MALSFQDFLSANLLDEILVRFQDPLTARVLLTRIGYPVAALPHWENPRQFWYPVCEQISFGIIEGGLEALLAPIATVYPGCDEFRRYVPAKPADPPPPGGPPPDERGGPRRPGGSAAAEMPEWSEKEDRIVEAVLASLRTSGSKSRRRWNITRDARKAAGEHLVEALADRFGARTRALRLLSSVGFDKTRVPEWIPGHALEFWSAATQEVVSGAVEGGLAALLAASAREAPDCEAFLPYRRGDARARVIESAEHFVYLLVRGLSPVDEIRSSLQAIISERALPVQADLLLAFTPRLPSPQHLLFRLECDIGSASTLARLLEERAHERGTPVSALVASGDYLGEVLGRRGVARSVVGGPDRPIPGELKATPPRALPADPQPGPAASDAGISEGVVDPALAVEFKAFDDDGTLEDTINVWLALEHVGGHQLRRLIVEGPDQARFELENVPGCITGAELAQAVINTEYDPKILGVDASGAPLRMVVERQGDAGPRRLRGHQTLQEQGVQDGDTLTVYPEARAGAGVALPALLYSAEGRYSPGC